MDPRSINPPFHRTLRVTQAAGDAPFLDVPASPGVALFETDRGEAVSVVAGADLRQLVRARLSPEHAALSTKSLIGVASIVHLHLGESEALRRLVWLLTAHRALPRLADEAAKSPPCWFLRLDARDEFPKAVAKAPRELIALDDLAGVYGPFATKKAALRAGEAVTDALDLCRHHHLLVLAPRASACAYKDMGRCPAPCDGSESMESYRSRVADGQAWLADAPAMRARTQAAMRDAAASTDFERAGALKTLLERTAALDGAAGPIAARSWVVLSPAAHEGHVCVIACSIGHVAIVGDDVPPRDVPLVLDGHAPPPGPGPMGTLGADVLGWAGALARMPDDKAIGRRAARVLALGSDGAALEAAAADVVERAGRSASVE